MLILDLRIPGVIRIAVEAPADILAIFCLSEAPVLRRSTISWSYSTDDVSGAVMIPGPMRNERPKIDLISVGSDIGVPSISFGGVLVKNVLKSVLKLFVVVVAFQHQNRSSHSRAV